MAGAWRAAGWLAICLLRPGLGLAGATQHTLTKLTVGWLQPVVDAERPLVMELDGERVALTGFVATCPARIEPCNGVQQNNKVRTTTDKS